MGTRSVALVVGLAAGMLAGCARDSGETTTPTSTTERAAITTSTTATPTTTSATVRASTTTSTTVYPTTTVHRMPDDCDVDAMLATVDRDLAAARLVAGGAWSTDTEGVAFDERTEDAESFRARLGLDCTVRAVQRTDTGAERLVLAAWTGDRHAFVVQATDRPTEPYRREQRFELFVEWPYGEWIEDQLFWAGTLELQLLFVRS